TSVFIEVRSDHRKRFAMKTLSLLVSIVFMVQQLAYSLGINYGSSMRITPVQVAVEEGSYSGSILGKEKGDVSVDIETMVDECIETTSYDFIKYKRSGSGVGNLLSTGKEQEQAADYAPGYLKRQQAKHEEILRQKKDSEDLILQLQNRNRKPGEEYAEQLPLKKKMSASPGSLGYTVEDFDENGNPRQMNVYEYNGDGSIKSIVTYDISDDNPKNWLDGTEEKTDDEGNTSHVSYRQLDASDLPEVGRMIKKTVYDGENIDYILSNYDENDVPRTITVFDYKGKPGEGLDETVTYNIGGLGEDFSKKVDKSLLTDEMVTRRTVYDGKEEASISYILEGYTVSEEGENSPSIIRIYDYESDEDAALDEVRAYHIDGLEEEGWLTEDASRLESRSVYEGDKDEELVQYMLSKYEGEGAGITAWERKEFTYDGEGAMLESRVYNISGVDESEHGTMGTGELEETSVYEGDKNYEILKTTFSVYDGSGNATRQAEYVYAGRSLRELRIYGISGEESELLDLTEYEGKNGSEHAVKITNYLNGTKVKELEYEYAFSATGVEYISGMEETTYSGSTGEVVEKIYTENSILYENGEGEQVEDANAFIRSQSRRLYSEREGGLVLKQEEEIILSGYTHEGYASLEDRTIYNITEEGERGSGTRQVTENRDYNFKGMPMSQSITYYMIDSEGVETLDVVKDIWSEGYDYYGNISARVEESYEDAGRTELASSTIVENFYEDAMAKKRGNATLTRSTVYAGDGTQVEKNETVTESFDGIGNALTQESTHFVYDDATGEFVKESYRAITSSDYNGRGDAESQTITSYRVDMAGGEEVVVFDSMEELTNREFDASHRVTNYMVISKDESGETVEEIKEIRIVNGFSVSGVAYEQRVVTYEGAGADGSEKGSVIEVTVTQNLVITAGGNVVDSVVTRYEDAEVEEEGAIIVSGSDRIDEVYMHTDAGDFDKYGNALKQTVTSYWYNSDEVREFGDAREILNEEFDIHGRVLGSVTLNYEDETREVLASVSHTYDITYNQKGDVTYQVTDMYGEYDGVSGEIVEASYIKTTKVVNEYVSGYDSPDTSTVTVYSDKAMAEGSEIERTVTVTDIFNGDGNAEHQVSTHYIYDGDLGGFVEESYSEITNSGYNSRGDAIAQSIIRYNVDLVEGERVETFVSHTVMTNREFDAQHNVVNYMVISKDEAGDAIEEIQEIRIVGGFYPSGVAHEQRIVTYEYDAAGEAPAFKGDVIEVNFTRNLQVTADGNVLESLVIRYGGATIAENADGEAVGDIEPVASSLIDETYITTDAGDFDKYGRALEQEIISFWYDTDGERKFGDARRVVNAGFDTHGRTLESYTFNYMEEAMETLDSVDHTHGIVYNDDGNVEYQITDIYEGYEEDGGIITGTGHVKTTRTENVYTSGEDAPDISTVTVYSDAGMAAESQVEKTVTETTEFEEGQPKEQTSTHFVYDDGTGSYVEESCSYIAYSDYNNRGDAGHQDIITYLVDDVEGERVETFSSHTVMTNREFDAQHRVVNYMMVTKNEAGETKDIQEIRVEGGFHASGVGRIQMMITYEYDALNAAGDYKGDIKEVNAVYNMNITSVGNVMDSVVYRYEAGEVNWDTGKIEPDESTMIDETYLHTDEESFDKYGNAFEQVVTTYWYDTDGERRFSESRRIVNESFDIHGRMLESYTFNYLDEGMTQLDSVSHTHDVTYNISGNVENQVTDEYSGFTMEGSEVVCSGHIRTTTVENVYDGEHGTPVMSTVTVYSDVDLAEEHCTERTVTESLGFDDAGNVLEQRSTHYVYEYDEFSGTGEFVEESYNLITNSGYNNRGDASSQTIITYNVDIIDGERVVTFASRNDMTNREFDAMHRVTNYMAVSKNEAGDNITEIQEIRIVGGFHASGVAHEQRIVTYAYDEATFKGDIVGVQLISNYEVSGGGNVLGSRVVTYGYAEILDNEEMDGADDGEIVLLDEYRIDDTYIVTAAEDFDKYGRATKQTMTSWWYDTDGARQFGDVRVVENAEFDTHGRVLHSYSFSYNDLAMSDLASMQEVYGTVYDVYGNVLSQVVDTYGAYHLDGTTGEVVGDEYVNSKLIENEYTTAPWSGNADVSAVTVYSDISRGASSQVEKTVTETLPEHFDDAGNPLEQTSTHYVYIVDEDTGDGDFVKESYSVITNSGYNNRGDASSQVIVTYNVDFDSGSEVHTFQGWTEMNNRVFDPQHRVTNYMVVTKDQSGNTQDIQEIRVAGFHASGTAYEQTIVTYLYDAGASDGTGRGEVVDVNFIENVDIASNGNVLYSIVHSYAGATIEDDPNMPGDRDGNIVLDDADRADETHIWIEEGDFDEYGNALVQHIESYWYDIDGTRRFGDARMVENLEFDIHARSLHSYTMNYNDQAMSDLDSMQEIYGTVYDNYGNVLTQVVDSYGSFVRDGVSGDVTPGDYMNTKVMENEYTTAPARGNASRSVVTVYSDVLRGDESRVDRTVTETAQFDNFGNALEQVSTHYVYDDGTGEFIEESYSEVTNEGYNNRGDASSQTIVNNVVDLVEGERVVSFQSRTDLTNRVFDSQHRATNYMSTYRDEEGDIFKIEEIRMVGGFYPSGVAHEQRVVTYDYDPTREFEDYKGDIIRVNVITNETVSAMGNVIDSTITVYSDATVVVDGAITPNQDTKVTRTVTHTDADDFDKYGNALYQTVKREVNSGGEFVEESVTYIESSGYDTHGNAHTQIMTGYTVDLEDEVRTEYFTSHQVVNTRDFDAHGNAINQEILSYSDISEEFLLDVQEIRSTLYHPSGVALEQRIATYSDPDKTDLLDIKVIENTDIDATGNVGTSTITKYSARLGTDVVSGEINPDPASAIDKQVVSTVSYDDQGNALEQDILRYYYEGGAFELGESQMITSSGFDTHGRAANSVIITYSDEAMSVETAKQEIDYLSYDRYGNVLEQIVRRYTVDEATGYATVYSGYSEITNVYGDAVARRRGNATETTTVSYNSSDVKTGRTVTVSSNFTAAGHAQDQTISSYVMDGELEKLTKVTDIVNENINNRGDAATQRITVSQTDADGLDAQVISYQVLTNRSYDTQHNIINQEIFTYTDDTEETLLDVQEIRNIGYYSSGVAREQRIATYSDSGKTDLLDVKVVVNTDIDADGNVGRATITKYADRLAGDIMAGTVNPDPDTAIDKQVVTTTSFDARGNALEQDILRYYWETSSFVFGEAQHIESAGHDIHDRAATSSITSYSDVAMTVVTGKQDIVYSSYDRYGNVLAQVVSKYIPDEATGEPTVYAGKSEITNVYGNLVAARRGNATQTTTITYNSSDVKTGRTVTVSSNFTATGHAQGQTISSYVMDGELEKLAKVTDIANEDINNRGDAGTQRITVSQTDENGENAEVISYQVLTNRSYDAQHNIVNQEIFTYTDDTEATLLDVQEIRNSGYNSSGVAYEQKIATYSDAAKTELL
ncbi:MAG: hypothetical protein PHH49_08340, partial [Candidatus Omnitrophica bacterium]|nr:hypothetical protein [Candidatus Omnitrophota bacterium]